MNRYLKNLLGICIAVGAAFSAHAQWPDRAIKIVVPYGSLVVAAAHASARPCS